MIYGQRDESRKPKQHGQRIQREDGDGGCQMGELELGNTQVDGNQPRPKRDEDEEIDFGDGVIVDAPFVVPMRNCMPH